MTRTFIELPEFTRKWAEMGLTDDDLKELELYLTKYPESGRLIQGTGGLRKIRWNMPNRGTRGGIRILYVDFAFQERAYLITTYSKTEKDDLTQDQKKEIKRMIKLLE